ncbi:sensor histidine kinase [Clostridium intestinale]|uniref:histidine kinase n=1 Tax=Clostridium intestinale DSM 6191 TaxID=1121320 RepID=A0A1M5YL25_9CLOT|nr:HAMP domain-containing sensor histidine kinase [Clostridium intestinale]SHI12588.1 His Kinase A (phospho-acceptor) domain-containing protein [Clostridium intestinale DSM 6191]
MFKKLRNRFLILNLVIISVMLLISFTSIYAITHKNIYTQIDMDLDKLSGNDDKGNKPKINGDMPNDKQMDGPQNDFTKGQGPMERYAFTVTTDGNWNKLSTFSRFSISDEFYESAKKAAINKKVNRGYISVDDTDLAFVINHNSSGYNLYFLDITFQKNTLRSLIYTFTIVAFFMLIIIFLISRFFANRSIQPIKEAFDKQKQFIADASHELKTPLTVINTNVDVLLSNKDDLIHNQSKWLYYIKSEAERMNKLTSDLLYLAQVDYSDVKMIFSDFNLSEAVEHIILTMEGVVFENNIALHYDIEPNLIVSGNIEQLKQVIMIFLDNAIKYTDKKGKINLVLNKAHNKINLSVTNTGKGIPEEHISKIFNRFYRTDKSRARDSGGYGLGLSIAKAIVEQHNGKISVKSIVDKETTFTIELPKNK